MKANKLAYLVKLAVAFLLVPVSLLTLAEAGLRVAGYGCSTCPFITKTIDGRTCHSLNFEFFRQFMPWWPYPVGEAPYDTVIPEKPTGTYRIAILGSSAAHGWYFPDFNFGRVLEVMLRERFPETRFEVCDLSYIAMNSHVMRYMAREAASRIQPDLFVVYMGNNEVKGTLGVLHAMNTHGWVPMDWLVRGFVFSSNLRLVQAGLHAVEQLGGRKSVWSPWQSSAGIASMSDPRIRAIGRNFRANLEAICDIAASAGASVALCTLQRNLRDYPPDQSLHGPTITPDVQRQWESLFRVGIQKQSAGDWGGALEQYRQAALLDAGYAELQFRMGTCLWSSGQFEEARAAFMAAQESNFGLLSANAHINAAVAETAATRAGQRVYLVDAAAQLAARSPHQTPGHDLFFDHVHFTFDGNYALARAVYERIVDEIKARIQSSGGSSGRILTGEECAERLAFSSVEQLRELDTVIAYLKTNVPNAPCDDFVAALNRLQVEIGSRTPEVEAEACHRALELNPGDLPVRWRYIKLLLSSTKYTDAEAEARILLGQYPLHWRPHWALAAALSGQQEHQEALDAAEFLTANYPDCPETWYRLGELLGAADRFPDALDAFRRAAATRPLNDAVKRSEGQVFERMGDPDSALSAYRDAVNANPQNRESYALLDALLRQGKYEKQCVSTWQEIAKEHPDIPLPLYHLGLAYTLEGDAGRAQDALAAAARMDSAFASQGQADALAIVGDEAVKRSEFALAVASYASASKLRPENIDLRIRYGKALGAAGRSDDAVTAFLDVIALNPSQPEPYQELETLLKPEDQAKRLATWRVLAAKHPAALQPHLRLARVLMDCKDVGGALSEYKSACEVEPGALWVRAEFGRALLLGHRTEEALDNLQAVIAKSPDTEYVRPYIIQALIDLDRKDEAQQLALDTVSRKEPVPIDISREAQDMLAASRQPQ